MAESPRMTFSPAPGGSYAVFVLGASGDLAHKKTYPSLFELFCKGLLPSSSVVVGYARSAMSDDAFRATIRGKLKGGSEEQRDAFIAMCLYRSGGYDDAAAFARVSAEVATLEDALSHNGVCGRVFYLAIPPSVFVAAAATVHASGLTTRGWNRVVVEKPFGVDSATSEQLSRDLAQYLSEDMIYRIDHYLGKEMVQNLLVLRFGNAVFEPLWSRAYISNVQITFKEPFGTEGRGGYFDGVGIVRDVMQNHLMQVMSLVAMEPPVSLSSEDIRDEKVKVLKCTAPVRAEDLVIGQYGPDASGSKPGYTDDPGVPKGSHTPTFATAVLHVNNARWRGVPFILKCGKALNERKAEIRVQFRQPSFGLFAACPPPHSSRAAASDDEQDEERLGVGQEAAQASGGVGSHPLHNNELVIRIQEDESIYLKMMSKMPGLEFVPAETELNLSYKSRYPSRAPPEAYARLILDVLRGDQSQFVRSDELAAAWAIFTPILQAIDAGRNPALHPVVYPYGSRGPTQSDRLIQRYGYVYEGRYAGAYRAQHNGPAATERVLDAMRAEFALPRDRLARLVADFVGEMHRGLRGEPGASIKMIPSYVTALPSGTEAGSYWAIDMGGSNLRVMETVLAGGGGMSVGREHKVVIPVAVMTGTAVGLFDFVADAMRAAGVPAGAVVGFTFSFPVNQTAVDAGALMEWTKGFSATGVVGVDVMGLLEAACVRKGLAVRLTALVNDTVGTLLACAYGDTATRMGVILGTGTNAAYLERVANIPKWTGPPAKEGATMVINMEWGGFGSGNMAHLPFSPADHALDALTPNEGRQRFEKQISGMYLGEITRQLLLQLHSAGALFTHPPGAATSPVQGSRLSVPWALTTAAMSEIASDESPDLSAVGGVLARDLSLGSLLEAVPAGASPRLDTAALSLDDRRLVQEVCALVGRRAARLSAAGVAAVLQQCGTDGHGVHVGFDGSVFKRYPRFSHWMSEALAELGYAPALVLAEDGSGIGAALVAAVALEGGAVRSRQ